MKVKIISQRVLGQADWTRVCQVLEDGTCIKYGIIVDYCGLFEPEREAKEIEIIGDFETLLQWKDYRNKWHDCTEGKYMWCNSKNIPTRRIYKYVGQESKGA